MILLLYSQIILLGFANSLKTYHLGPNPHTPKEATTKPSITIGEDPKGNLPVQFSICVSTYSGLETRARLPYHHVLDIRGEGASKEQMEDSKAYYLKITLELEYSTLKNTGFVITEGAMKTLLRFGRVRIEEWIHMCVSVDAISGNLAVVVNGEVGFNETNPYLENSEDKMPKSAVNSVWFYGRFIILKYINLLIILQKGRNSPISISSLTSCLLRSL